MHLEIILNFIQILLLQLIKFIHYIGLYFNGKQSKNRFCPGLSPKLCNLAVSSSLSPLVFCSVLCALRSALCALWFFLCALCPEL
jgi:hypothetical protein